MTDKLLSLAGRAIGLHETLAKCHPTLERGLVQCRTCRRIEKVDSAECLRSGWPKCCGYTMTIDVDCTRNASINSSSEVSNG